MKDKQRQPKKNTERLRSDRIFRKELQSCEPSSLPLMDYIRAAYDYQRDSMPESTSEQWYSPMWHFVRLLKAHPALQELDGDSAYHRVHRALREMLGLEEWFSSLFDHVDDEEAAYTEFVGSWDKVRHLPGSTPLTNALRLAKTEPFDPAPRRTAGYQLFISIAFHLQRFAGNVPILLPVEPLADLLGVEPRTVSRYRQMAEQDGYLVVLKQHVAPIGGHKGCATEFRFIEKPIQEMGLPISTNPEASQQLGA